jgi:hypothetical protein
VNIFLITLNTEIKFQHYFKMIQQDPPMTARPDDVLVLMRRVVELVDLLYWMPVPMKGLKGSVILAERALLKCKSPERTRRSSQPQYTETISGEEGGVEGPSKALKSSKHFRRLDWLASADLDTRKAYGSALMSGHGTSSLLFDL